MKKITYCILLIFLTEVGKSQFFGSDPSWVLVKQDNFDSLNNSNWYNTYPWGNWAPGVDVAYYSSSNLLFNYSSGYLAFKAERPTTPIIYTYPAWAGGATDTFYYRSGAIWSKFKLKYGYYEMSAKLPQGLGFHTSLYMFSTDTPGIGPCHFTSGPNVPGKYWNEIDALENGAIASSDTSRVGGGYLYMDPDSCTNNGSLVGKGIPFQNLLVPGNTTQEHKYGLLWEPNKITFYFDDKIDTSFTDATFIPHNAMSMVLTLGMDGGYFPDVGTPSATLPNYYQVNYFKAWQLQAECGIAATICGSIPGNYNFKVKKSIELQPPSCGGTTGTINTSSNVGLWATDYIIIHPGQTINADGSGTFSASITQCPN